MEFRKRFPSKYKVTNHIAMEFPVNSRKDPAEYASDWSGPIGFPYLPKIPHYRRNVDGHSRFPGKSLGVLHGCYLYGGPSPGDLFPGGSISREIRLGAFSPTGKSPRWETKCRRGASRLVIGGYRGGPYRGDPPSAEEFPEGQPNLPDGACGLLGPFWSMCISGDLFLAIRRIWLWESRMRPISDQWRKRILLLRIKYRVRSQTSGKKRIRLWFKRIR